MLASLSLPLHKTKVEFEFVKVGYSPYQSKVYRSKFNSRKVSKDIYMILSFSKFDDFELEKVKGRGFRNFQDSWGTFCLAGG